MLALTEVRFRANPLVELAPAGELAPEQREAFRDLERDAEFYGLFVPKPPLKINLKSTGRQTAELFRMLAAPARLDPALLREDEPGIVDLVLDGILEVENDGVFVCGADALPLVCAPADATHDPLSRDALLHAQDLETSDTHALTMALYFYGRIPLSPFWRSRFPDGEAVLTHVGADRGALRALLEREWIFSAAMRGWLCWTPRAEAARGDDDVTYKLYVSPRPERIRDAFAVVARVLADFPGAQFKIGSDAAGLLRPDKLVAHFDTRDQLGQAAETLARELTGCEAHGVPFTAAVGDGALLSWGVDPPEDERPLRWRQRESWRLWLAQRLGAAMAMAKNARSASAAEPWRFALERVRREGVDVGTWTPTPSLWSRA